MAARTEPFVDAAVRMFGGTVKVIAGDGGSSTPPRRSSAPATAGRCRCGCEQWDDVPVHGGQSLRRDCARCGRYQRFVVWYGKGCDDERPVVVLPAVGRPASAAVQLDRVLEASGLPRHLVETALPV
jgi:hypothetical protein